jgi:hypothetical protein
VVDGGFAAVPVGRRSAPPLPIVPVRIPFGMVTTVARAAATTTAKTPDTVTRMSATTTTTTPSTSTINNNHRLMALYQKELMDIFTTSDTLDSIATTTTTTTTLRRLEQLINQLEELYVPPQTLPFLNFAMDGTWQLLFSTATPTLLWTTTTTKSTKSTTTNTTLGDGSVVVSSRSSNSSSSNNNTTDTFRLRGIEQEVQCRQFRGTITNTCGWELWCPPEGEDTTNGATRWWECCCAGTFRVIANYTMTSSGRIVFDAKDLSSSSSSSQPLAEHEPASSSPASDIERILQLAPGSSVPHNISQLVSDLQRSIPKELLDLNNHAMDTTYLDTQLRIVRYTGPRYESVRNVWIRK